MSIKALPHPFSSPPRGGEAKAEAISFLCSFCLREFLRVGLFTSLALIRFVTMHNYGIIKYKILSVYGKKMQVFVSINTSSLSCY